MCGKKIFQKIVSLIMLILKTPQNAPKLKLYYFSKYSLSVQHIDGREKVKAGSTI